MERYAFRNQTEDKLLEDNEHQHSQVDCCEFPEGQVWGFNVLEAWLLEKQMC